jgi:thiamine pyrophosphate-dependent acetolactate synthase large subunit-like protein
MDDNHKPEHVTTGSQVRAAWGSDLVADALREQNIPYICLNPGASYRGLHDSIVNYLGNESPKMVVCMHEEHAIAICHGYALVTEKSLAAVVHSNVGLMHATMAIFNAWCGRVPVLVIGATGPVDAMKRRPWIDWIHTTADQGALVRDYTKWDDQPASAPAAVEAIRRASLIARTKPCGPVYVNLDVAMQESHIEGDPKFEPVTRYQPPPATVPSHETVDQAVEVLKNAKRPLILCGRVSRTEESWKQRVKLAEWTGARVLTHIKEPAGFPTDHPLYLTESGWKFRPKLVEWLKGVDAVLCLDWFDPAGSIHQAFPVGSGGPKVINASMDYQLHKGWVMDYQGLPPVDIWMATTPESAVTALLEGLERVKAPKRPVPQKAIPKIAPPTATSGTINITDMARVFANRAEGQPLSIISRPLGWPPNANIITHPLDFFGAAGGGGLGAGPGIAVGAALALRDHHPDRIPVAILGDGDYMMGCNALWTAANMDIPLLLVIANNRSYYNDEEHQKHIAEHRGRPVENAPVGQRIEMPPPDLAAIARAQGWEGEGPVTDLAKLPAALDKAFAAVKQGKRYLLDVLIAPEYVRAPLVDYL